MKVLRFRGKYRDAIISGRKRTTIRRESSLRPGDLVMVEVGEERIGEALIKCVEEVCVEELNDELAEEDGFGSLSELLMELRSIYGDDVLREGTKLKLIRFEIVRRESA
ncbi:MAG: ASCH domain-containing protein [Candidatus Korarchaeota archaeon NZ13-K]|nr:MAG: ASCH domain-containing protein [Candidatus Korarchaeota archaeon NZ13-K]